MLFVIFVSADAIGLYLFFFYMFVMNLGILKAVVSFFRKLYIYSKLAFIYVYYNIRYIRKKYTIKKGNFAIVNIDGKLKRDDHSRYFYLICIYLEYAGFNVVVKTNWRDFTNLKPLDFKRLLLKQKYSFVRNCSTPLNTIVLVQPNTMDHIIYLSYGYNIIRSGHFDWIAPYPMYPIQYKFLTPAFLEALKKSDRTIKIFFSGNTDKRLYTSARLKKFFNIIPRLEVLEFICANFNKSIVLKNDSDKLVLNKLLNSDDYINNIIISELRTKEHDWLKILSKTEFFICPPGVVMPWSHNCIEAMSVGVIPILEYADLFYPHLKKMKNCLSYTNYEELRKAIEKALAMEASEIEQMRKNVLKYYNDYLAIDSIAKKIKTFSNSSRQELKVAIPFISTEEEWWVGLKPLFP